MQTFIAVILFILGLAFTVKGGDLFVSAATRIAGRFGIPQFIIGATVVSLATTLPEIIVSLLAAADGKTQMAVGNAVGSVTANTGLIMALSIIFMPTVCGRRDMGTKCLIMLLCAASLFLFSRGGSLSYFGSAVLFLLFVLFIFENIKQAKSAASQEKEEKGGKTAYDIIQFIIGAAGIIIGAQLLVDNATVLARVLGVSEALISVTVIAVGTSLPELVTTVTAIAKRQSSLSLGNILGANIIDTAIILPACSLLSGKPLPIKTQSYLFDIPVCLGIIGIAVIPALIGRKFSRWQGVIMLTGYIVYLVSIVFII